MPFREIYRQFLFKVTGRKCQWESYDEKYGFKECGKPAKQVHHIVPAQTLLAKGLDPEHTFPGLPLCEDHHVRNVGRSIFDRLSSFHPDVAGAYKVYRSWKQQELHMKAISEKPGPLNCSNSPFADVARTHKELAAQHRRYHVGSKATDAYYIEKMKEKIQSFVMATGTKEPHRDPALEYKQMMANGRKKKKHWYDGLFTLFTL